jgi:hypothetical protein
MKNAFVFLVSILAFDSYSQTLYVPSSTSGIGASANANSVGIGTASPRGQFDVAGVGDIFLVNNPVTGTAQSILLPGHIYMAPFNGTNWTYLQARRPDNSGSTNLMIRTWNAGAMSDAMSITSGGSVGIGTASPQQKLHVKSGALMSSSASFDNINLRADGTNIPALKFTRWVGSGSVQHNAFVGQFYNPSAGNEYSFGIGTGVSSSGDQDINNKVLTVTLNGNVGIGTTTPIRKLHVSGTANTIARIEATDDGYASLEFAGNNKTWQLSKRPSLNYSDALQLYYHDGSTWSSPHITFLTGGNVGIGTTDPGSFKLAVNGKTWSTEVQVAVTRPPDYVFEPTYDLKPLAEIETYIKENKHLPEVPSAKEMEKNGVQLGEMNMLLLKKVEELTLYVIEQQKENTKQADEIKELKKLIKK